MKKLALLALTVATSATIGVSSAHAVATDSAATTALSCTVPPSLFFGSQNVTYGTANITTSTTNATGKSIPASLQTNYHSVSLLVRAGTGATGPDIRKTPTGVTGVIVPGDIVVKNNDASNASAKVITLSTTDADLGTLSGFVPNTLKAYSFPVDINNISQYEQGTYKNTVLFTATGG